MNLLIILILFFTAIIAFCVGAYSFISRAGSIAIAQDYNRVEGSQPLWTFRGALPFVVSLACIAGVIYRIW